MGNREDYPRLRLGARTPLYLAISMLSISCSVLPPRQASEDSTSVDADQYDPVNASEPVPLATTRPPGARRAPPIFPTLTNRQTDDQTEPRLRWSVANAVGSVRPTVEPEGFWPLLSSEFALEHHLNQRAVQAAVDKYTKNPGWLADAQARLSLYLPYFLEETRRRNLPAELALLPIIESTLDPEALSPRGALGLWQFMPDTATRFGLSRDWWHDSRQDTVASTRAALDYLELLHDQFGDWLLSIAAYNAGEGTVARTLPRTRNKPVSSDRFFALDLPQETRRYVPQVLALAAIIKNPAKYDVSLPDISGDVPFTSVKTKGPVDLQHAASVLNVSPAELVALNPSLKRRITPPAGTDNLLVPIRVGAHAQASLNAMPDSLASGAIARYRVQRGDTLSTIARRFGSSVTAMKQLNGLASNTIRVDTTLQIPRLSAAGLASVRAEPALAASDTSAVMRYRVQRGDTLGSIARRFGSSTGALRSLNGMRSDVIKANAHLKVPRGGPKGGLNVGKQMIASTAVGQADQRTGIRPAQLQAKGATTGYRVQAGDSLSTIARAHHSTVAQLKLLNGMRGDQLRVNRVLRVPVVDGMEGNVLAASGLSPAQKDRHTVRAGDNLWRIARKYDVSHQALMRENGLQAGQVLSLGQVLRIPQPAASDIAGG